MQSKQTRCTLSVARLHGGDHAAVGYTTVLEVSLLKELIYFRNFANGSECKGLSAFIGKFPSSAAGLNLALKTSCLRKKSRLVRYHMVECFHAITIDAKRLHFRCERYCIILPLRNKSFSRNPFEFLHIWESLVSRSSGLDTQSSNVLSIEAQGSSLEVRVSSANLLLSGTVCAKFISLFDKSV